MNQKFLIAAALAAAPFTVNSQDARSLAATCANCHGTEGRSATREASALAGLPKDLIVSQMKAFKEGARPATIMHQLARGYTDRQIELIADYFAARK